MAAADAIVFVRAGDECETWQFEDQGKHLSWTGDDGLELSLTTEVAGADVVVLSELTATSRGLTTSAECSAAQVDDPSLYFEEDDCLAGRGGIRLEGECSRSLGAGARAELVAKLEASRAEAAAEARARNQQIAKDFRKRIERRKTFHWRIESTDGTVRCETWRKKGDEIVKSLGGGATMRYRFDVRLGRPSGRAEAHLTGPVVVERGKATSAMMSWDIRPITQLDDRGAKVGDSWWFFSAEACEAGPTAPAE